LVKQIGEADIQGNPLLRPWYMAQLVDHISIFPDLKEKFAADPRCTALLDWGALSS
jgi:hypothetical protein